MKEVAIEAARAAGKIQLEHLGKRNDVTVKSKTSLVTEVDLMCDKAVKKIILDAFPDHNIVSEETDRIDNKSEYSWHIDPIDGTHNFARGISLFGVSIGLEKNGEVELGVIYLPVFDELYIAEKGKGAFCNDKPIHVSKRDELDFSIVVADLGHSTREKSIELFTKFEKRVIDIRNFGCAVYGLCLLARGDVDSYIMFKTNSWDVSAGFLLVSEAGGKITHHDGSKWSLDSQAFISSNGLLHEEFRSFLE